MQMLHRLERTHSDVGHEVAGIGRDQHRYLRAQERQATFTHPSHLHEETGGGQSAYILAYTARSVRRRRGRGEAYPCAATLHRP